MTSTRSQKTLWDIALDERKEMLENADKDSPSISCETQLLICGSKDSGKSSLIQRFLDKEEATKPTVGLDCSYGRRSKQNNMTTVKDVCHIWELAGGTTMCNLIDKIITAENIKTISIVVMLDLSKPNELWATQELVLNQIKNRIAKVISETSKTDSGLENMLKEKAWERVGKNHADKSMITPLLVPLLFLGSKFDLHQETGTPQDADIKNQELSTDKRKMLSKSIRLLAHINGGMAQHFSTKADGMAGRVKSVLNHLAFNTALSKTSSTDVSKPLIVPFGSDSMEQIGAPPVSSDQLMRSRGGTCEYPQYPLLIIEKRYMTFSGKNVLHKTLTSKISSPYDLWKDAFAQIFPPSKTLSDEKKNPALDKQYSDEMIDNLRQQKDEEKGISQDVDVDNQELERYRKLSERKAKEAKLNATAGNKKNKR